jgi:hypothetical protein
MNWETYNTMTDKQKEEYNYKFKNNPITISIQGISSGITSITAFFALAIMVIYLGMKEQLFSQETVQLMMSSLPYGTLMFSVLGITFIVTSLIQIGYRGFSEFKWKRDNKIVTIKKVTFRNDIRY